MAAELLSQGVDLFYEAVMADEHLAPYFGRINMQKHRMKIVSSCVGLPWGRPTQRNAGRGQQRHACDTFSGCQGWGCLECAS